MHKCGWEKELMVKEVTLASWEKPTNKFFSHLSWQQCKGAFYSAPQRVLDRFMSFLNADLINSIVYHWLSFLSFLISFFLVFILSWITYPNKFPLCKPLSWSLHFEKHIRRSRFSPQFYQWAYVLPSVTVNTRTLDECQYPLSEVP